MTSAHRPTYSDPDCAVDSRPPLVGTPVLGCSSGYENCNAVIGANGAAAPAATATLTFTLTNYRHFRPRRLRFRGVNLAVTSNDHTRSFDITGITLLGHDYIGTATFNAAAFSLNSPFIFGPNIADMDISTDLTITAINREPAMGLTLTLYGVLDGWGVA